MYKIYIYYCPDSVTSIGIFAFGNCSGFTDVTIGNSVTFIDSRELYNCTSISIPDSVTSFGDYYTIFIEIKIQFNYRFNKYKYISFNL